MFEPRLTRGLRTLCKTGKHDLVYSHFSDAGWSSLAARRAHNPKVVGSNPAPATSFKVFCSCTEQMQQDTIKPDT